MRALAIAVFAAACTGSGSDIAGEYAVQSEMNSAPCDGSTITLAPQGYFVITAVTGGFDVTAFSDPAHTTPMFTLPAGIPLRTQIADGWSGTEPRSGNAGDAPGCYLVFQTATVKRAGSGLAFDSYSYSERATAACTDAEATRLATTMPCVQRVQIVAIPAD